MLNLLRPKMILFVLACSVVTTSCAPVNQRRVPKADFTFVSTDAREVTLLAKPFKADLERAEITIDQTGSAFLYEGEDERAFFAAVDKFYLENPGFCPVANGFLNTDQSLYLTLAARPLFQPGDVATPGEVRVLIYDQSNKPKLKFAFLKGSSRKAIAGSACRSANP